jgi:quinol monooxygenase YgiN
MEAGMKHTFVDNLVMIAELTIKPEKLEEFLDYTVDNLKISRSYPGNIAFDILIDETRPNRVLFYEVWESAEVQQAYMAWRVQAGDLTTLLAFLDGEPKFTPLRSIANER